MTFSLSGYIVSEFGPRCASRTHGQTLLRKMPESKHGGFVRGVQEKESAKSVEGICSQGSDYKDGTWNSKSVGGRGKREREYC